MTAEKLKWSEASIAREIQRSVFQRKCILLVPNIAWMVSEADVLGVTPNGHLIDIEIKISRADLKADAKKDKWWDRGMADWRDGVRTVPEPRHREWPRKIWRHYYVLPKDIWTPELEPCLGSKRSGVLLISGDGFTRIESWRRAQTNPAAQKLTPEEMLDVARLANLRMWDALAKRSVA